MLLVSVLLACARTPAAIPAAPEPDATAGADRDGLDVSDAPAGAADADAAADANATVDANATADANATVDANATADASGAGDGPGFLVDPNPACAPGNPCAVEGTSCTVARTGYLCRCLPLAADLRWKCSWTCPPSQPSGMCAPGSFAPSNSVCSYPQPGGGTRVCTCLILDGLNRADWFCTDAAQAPCPAAPVGPESSCSLHPVLPPKAFQEGCNFGGETDPVAYESHHCACQLNGAGDSRWTCSHFGCSGPVSGRCGPTELGQRCRFHGGDLECRCQADASRGPWWYCNGSPTPACPTTRADDMDCSGYLLGSTCRVAASICRCEHVSDAGDERRWRCYTCE